MRKIVLGIITSSFLTFTFSNAITRGELEKDPILRGKMLAKRCAWCHDINRTLVAPPFKVILNKYKNLSEEELKKKFIEVIKNGSKGKWSNWLKKHAKVKFKHIENMYMPPQKPYFTDEEIKLIANWLLSLKKK